jgi:hypothetical protein
MGILAPRVMPSERIWASVSPLSSLTKFSHPGRTAASEGSRSATSCLDRWSAESRSLALVASLAVAFQKPSPIRTIPWKADGDCCVISTAAPRSGH